ncbi:geranylgeranyl pyrophosphate synthase [Colletotrichum karsti]|uniref:Geranylgeranyl pyrophosphate synthase n=1 Tax=Colletotrichum karsti TaxID=1095194 RepID=A0A9P6HUE8_9PEZI|nr:geranylgeranyl pyrophosphate synthase [Colletotrichum karsti]KAF9869992.1 geranylgeranyl pyrophosphate synthase [Colletotrichum karsti]
MEPLSYQSKLVPAETARETGCFTTLPIRIHPRDDLADAASRRFVGDWAREMRDGREKKTYFSFSPVGNWSSLIYPEAIPERLGVLAYLSDLGLIHDDTGEGLSIEDAQAEHDELHDALNPDDKRNLDPASRAMKTKKLVSQCILECINLDHEVGLNMLAAFRDVWLAISEKNSDKEAQTLEEYLQYRSDNGGMLVFWPMLQFSLGISLSEAEHQLVQPIIDAATEGLLLANDYFSWERELRELQSGHSKRIVSAVELFARTKGLSVEGAKEAVKARIIKSESDFSVSGNHYWCSACPRQNAWKNETLPNGQKHNDVEQNQNGNGHHSPLSSNGSDTILQINGIKIISNGNGVKAVVNGNGVKRKLSQCGLATPEEDLFTKKKRDSGIDVLGQDNHNLDVHEVSQYPLYKPSNLAMDAPAAYICGMPSKGVRGTLIDALNTWLHVPPAAVKTITSVVNMLHNASLILDDLEDNSPLRRGLPSAHVIFGQAQSINSANFLFVRAVQEVAQSLSPAALTAVLEELEGLYLGQSWDLYWKFNLACPTESEYVNMIDHKTGGMFRMLLRIMQAESAVAETPGLDFERLTLLFGRFFQIRDDYMNFGDYAAQKGICEDLDEGKFSYPIVYCLTNHPEYRAHILGVFRQRPTVATTTASPLSKESKAHLCISLSSQLSVESGGDYVADFEQQPIATAGVDAGSLFWAQQQQAVRPACVVHARGVEDVVVVVRTSRSTGCPFAVRGGGHSDIPGASNSDGGITVNMAGLSDVEVDASAGVARVGAGAKWGAVFKELDKTNKTVVGGRLTGVGVGGLLLGGGLSHFSGLHGWACDNVRNYELVLANGSIIDVSHSTHPDLYRALRGGGNNFGVVTRFDLDLFDQGPMWGGLHVWPLMPDVTSAITSAFVEFAHDAPSDKHVSLFAGLGFMQGNFAWAVGQYDTLGREEPPIFAKFRDDAETYGAPKIVSTARVTSLSDLAEELNLSEPAGMRSRFTTATFKVDVDLLQLMAGYFVEEVERALDKGLSEDARFAPMLGIQPLGKNILQAQAKRGGNVMGLEEESGPLIVCSFGWEWSDEANDAIVTAGIQSVLEQSVAAAKERGLYHPFKYMNYAAEDQDPVGSYGDENVEFLKKVKETYDSEGLFAKLVPGGHKIK